MSHVVSSTEALVDRVTRALSELDLRVFSDLNRGFYDGLNLLTAARSSLVGALADNRVEEMELLETRHIVLKSIAALRPFTPQGGSPSERLLKIVGAFKGVADSFVEYEVPVRPREGEVATLLEDRMATFAEFSLELFEAKLQQLLETIEDLGEASDSEPVDEMPGENVLGPSIGYLQAIHRFGAPGCVYGAQSRRDNPYHAARALRVACGRLQGMLLSRYGIQDPLERLAKLEGRLTAFIEEVRTAGAPIEEPEGWLRRFRASRLDALRSMSQDLVEIEQQLRERMQEREQ